MSWKKASHEALCSQGSLLFLLEHLGRNLVSFTLIKIRSCYSRQLKGFRHIQTVPVLQRTPGTWRNSSWEHRIHSLDKRSWIFYKYPMSSHSHEQMMTRLGRAVHVCVSLAPETQCCGWGSRIEKERELQAQNNRADTFSGSGQGPGLVK